MSRKKSRIPRFIFAEVLLGRLGARMMTTDEPTATSFRQRLVRVHHSRPRRPSPSYRSSRGGARPLVHFLELKLIRTARSGKVGCVPFESPATSRQPIDPASNRAGPRKHGPQLDKRAKKCKAELAFR